MILNTYPDSKVHGANMGPTWVLPAPDGPHVGPMNLANWGVHYVEVNILNGLRILRNIVSLLELHWRDGNYLLNADTSLEPHADEHQTNSCRGSF